MLELNRLFSVECIYTAIEPIWEENFNCDAFKRHTGFTPSEYKRIFNNTATYVQKNKENCNGDNA